MSRGTGQGEEGENGVGGTGTLGQIRGLVGRWPDADELLQGGMSEGLRDWDLWYVCIFVFARLGEANDSSSSRGPLLFCLLLSFLLSLSARADQRAKVFSGVFAMIWLGEAAVTLQIKLLGGHM